MMDLGGVSWCFCFDHVRFLLYLFPCLFSSSQGQLKGARDSPHILPLTRHAGSGLHLGTHDARGVEGSPRSEVLELGLVFGSKG